MMDSPKKAADQPEGLQPKQEIISPQKTVGTKNSSPQVKVSTKESSPRMKVGTIYGSSILRQSPQNTTSTNKSPGPSTSGQQVPCAGNVPQQARSKPTVLVGKQPGQNVPATQASSVGGAAAPPQLCLKFVKSTKPDGKPGITAVLQPAVPHPVVPVSNRQQSPQQLKTAGLTPQQKQYARVLLNSSSVSPAQQRPAVPQIVLSRPRQITTPVTAPAQAKTARRKNTAPKKNAPVDETEAAVSALIASTSGTAESAVAPPREPGRLKWPMAKPKTTRAKPYSRPQPATTKIAQQPSPFSTQSSAETAQKLLHALTTLLNQQKGQAQKAAASPKEPGPSTSTASPPNPGPSTSTRYNYSPEPHQLPPDEDRFGLLNQQFRKRPKKTQQLKVQKPPPQQPKVATPSPQQPKVKKPPPQHKEPMPSAAEARDWSEVVRNVDVFMFPVYRCKLCPNYYSTVKITMTNHMKDIHRWSLGVAQPTPVSSRETMGAGAGMRNRVQDIKDVFETRLRSESSDNFSLGLELERQNEMMEHQRGNEIVEVPFSNATDVRGDSSGDDDFDDAGGYDVDEDDDDVAQNEQEEGGGQDGTEKDKDGIANYKEEETEEEVVKIAQKKKDSEKESKYIYVPVVEKEEEEDLSRLTEVRPAEFFKKPLQKSVTRKDKDKKGGLYRRRRRNKGNPNLFQKGDKNIIYTIYPKKKPSSSSSNDNNDKEQHSEDGEEKGDDQTKTQTSSKDGGESETPVEAGDKAAKKTPVKARATTRSMTKTPGDATKETGVDDSGVPKKWIQMTRYEAWKKIGLDPKSKPPWPCTNPACKGKRVKFYKLANVMLHHQHTHDLFGDRQQRAIALALGERYSLFRGREKRAVGRANDEDGEGSGKGKRVKKPVQRLSLDIVEKSGALLPKTVKDKMKRKNNPQDKVRCPICYRYLLSDKGLKVHIRMKHKIAWVDRYRVKPNDTKDGNDGEANIAMLAEVAHVLGDEDDAEMDLTCKHCGFEAQSIHQLFIHMDRSHPRYTRSRYSDDDDDDEDEEAVEEHDGDENTPSTSSSSTSAKLASARPVRNCRKNSLPKMLAKEAKLDDTIPPVVPNAPNADELESEDDEDYHDNDPVLKCHICGFLAVTPSSFRSHVKSMHNQDVVLQFQCSQCEFVGTGQQLFFHRKVQHTATLVCDGCGCTIKGEKSLQKHKEVMCGKTKVKIPKQVHKECPVCSKVFNTTQVYRLHLRGHRDGEYYYCDLCPNKYKYQSAIRNHKARVHPTEMRKCNLCAFETPFEDKYKLHLYNRHKIGLEDLPILHCPQPGCDFTTKQRVLLVSHKRRHDPSKYKYWCNVCNQAVNNARSLARHHVMHRDGITKYKCKTCNYQATNSNTYREHQERFHDENANGIMCGLCGESFNTIADLRRHNKLKHSDDLPFKCKTCDAGFKYYMQRRKHINEAHPELHQAELEKEKKDVEKILSAPPKRVKGVRKPHKKKPPVPPHLRKKPGRKPEPLTPEVIARRAEIKRVGNKRKWQNREARRKAAGLKRKRYGKRAKQQQEAAARRELGMPMRRSRTAPPVVVDPHQEAATAAERLENIAQAVQEYASGNNNLQSQGQYPSTSRHQQHQEQAGVLPVKIVPVNATGINQGLHPTALHREYSTEVGRDGVAQTYAIEQVVSTSSGSYNNPGGEYPAFSNQEIVIETGTAGGVAGQQQFGGGTTTSYPTMTIAQDGSVVSQGADGYSRQPPTKYFEVTTVQSDGSKKVEMWPAWQEAEQP